MFVYPVLKPRKEITTQKGLPGLPYEKLLCSNTVKNILNHAVILPIVLICNLRKVGDGACQSILPKQPDV